MRVELVNAFDAMQTRRRQIAAEAVRRCVVNADCRPDTVQTAVPPSLVNQLGLDVRLRWDGSPSCGPILFVSADESTADEATVADGPVALGRCVLAKLAMRGRINRRRAIRVGPAVPDS